MSIVLRNAQKSDNETIKNVLQKNNLPYQDIDTGKINFFLANKGKKFIGIIGLERFDNMGLLRSMVVNEEYRNKGYGAEICKALKNYAQGEQIEYLYLLTCTAKKFFEKNEFKVIERNSVPNRIKGTTEFSKLCPASAICMLVTLV